MNGRLVSSASTPQNAARVVTTRVASQPRQVAGPRWERAAETAASTAAVSASTWPVIRARSSGSASDSTSRRSAVTGVRSRCDRSALSSRSRVSIWVIRAPRPLSTRPTDATSAGPAGSTSRSRSPPPTRSATSASTVTDRDSRPASAAPTATAMPSRTTPTRPPASPRPPAPRRAAPGRARTCGSPRHRAARPPAAGTCSPPRAAAVNAAPLPARLDARASARGRADHGPVGQEHGGPPVPVLTPAPPRAAGPAAGDPTSTVSPCASCRAAVIARSSASEPASRPSGTSSARSTAQVRAAP